MNIFSELEYSLTCPITQELFVNPIIIPSCGHTFEYKALHNYINISYNNNSKIICPICQINIYHSDISTFPCNFIVKQLISDLKNKKLFTDSIIPSNNLVSTFCNEIIKTHIIPKFKKGIYFTVINKNNYNYSNPIWNLIFKELTLIGYKIKEETFKPKGNFICKFLPTKTYITISW